MRNLFKDNGPPAMQRGFVSEGRLYSQTYKWATNSKVWSWDDLSTNKVIYYSSCYNTMPYTTADPYDVGVQAWNQYWGEDYAGGIIGPPRTTIYADYKSLVDSGMKGIYMPVGDPNLIKNVGFPDCVEISGEVFVFGNVTNFFPPYKGIDTCENFIQGPPSATFASNSNYLQNIGGIGFWQWKKLIKNEMLEPDEIQPKGQRSTIKSHAKMDWEVLHWFYLPYIKAEKDRYPENMAQMKKVCYRMMGLSEFLPKPREVRVTKSVVKEQPVNVDIHIKIRFD